MTEDRKELKKAKALDTFKPSWFDRVVDNVDALPGPFWLTYLLFGLLLAGLGFLVQLFDATRPTPRLDPLEGLVIFQITFMLTLITYLKKAGAQSLNAFLPAFRGSDQQAASLRLHMTSMPARSINHLTLIFFIIFSLLGFWMMNYVEPGPLEQGVTLAVYSFTPTPFGFYAIVVGALLWLVNVIFIFNTVQQLRTIDYALTQCAEIHLFHQTELYAFSRVLAARSIGFVLTSPIWLILDPGLITLFVNIIFSALALIIFISPLVGVHRLLEEQKNVLLKESGGLKEKTIRKFFARLKREEHEQVGQVGKTLEELTIAHAEIEKISTWPWQTNTIRQIAGAITLPIVIWMIQFFLSRLLET